MAFKHKKQFGQNFLKNPMVLSNIIDVAGITKDETVLEIGPGEGALTEHLLEEAKKVICIEIDRDLEKILTKKFSDNEKFNLIMKDVLTLDFDKEIAENVKVVANIPYYITSPIINMLIENRKYIDEIYIMIQKEVAERISAKLGSKNRSVLTFSVEYFGDAELLFVIPKEDFEPSPKVDSAFLKIKLRKDNKFEKEVEEEKFFKYVKAGFASKRKNIINNISKLGYSKDILREKFSEIDIDPNRRAETLSVEEFIKLINIVES